MTAKRFTIVDIEEELYPMPVYFDNHKKKELEYNEVCELLNKLHEENQALKHEISVINQVIIASKIYWSKKVMWND